MGWTGQEGALEAELAYMEKQSRPLEFLSPAESDSFSTTGNEAAE
jgi:hypothetical protein